MEMKLPVYFLNDTKVYDSSERYNICEQLKICRA